MANKAQIDDIQTLDNVDWSEVELEMSADEQSQTQSQTQGGAGASAGGIDQRKMASLIKPPEKSVQERLDISYLLDVELQVMVEVGRRLVHISELLGYDQGAIIELDHLVGQPLELTVNGRSVARGEVVVVNEKFALRITEILDPQDRLQQLRD